MKPEVMDISHLFGCSEKECKEFFDSSEPKFDIGERVKACGWGGSVIAIIQDVRVTYHPRMECYCWGYKVDKNPGLTFNYIPEGYLRKIDENDNEID